MRSEAIMRRAASILALLLVIGLAACQRVTTRGPRYLDEASLANDPPYTLAILPTTDRTNHPELAQTVREVLYEAISTLPYADRELATVDRLLGQIASRRGVALAHLPPEAMVSPELGEAVLFSELVDVRRLYLLFYAHNRFDLDLKLVDTRSRKVLYRNLFVFYDRTGGPSITVLGLFERSISSLMHLRERALRESLEEAAQEIVTLMPRPTFDVARGELLRISRVTVAPRDKVLGAGDTVQIHTVATPGCTGRFSIGSVKRDLPLREAQPGHYYGQYEIVPGDQSPFAVVEVQLASPATSETLEFAASGQPLVIDTEPPPPPRIARWWQTGAGVFFEIEPGGIPRDDNDLPVAYNIYRRLAGQGEFQKTGEAREPVFRDGTARGGQRYEYYALAVDRAGNISVPSGIVTITPRRH